MDKKILSEKSLVGSLVRIGLLLLITVGSLFILVMIYSVIIGDFPRDKNNTILTFNPDLMHGHGNSNHSVVKKPTLLESIKDMYMILRYGNTATPVQIIHPRGYHKAEFTEKIVFYSPFIVNWDKKLTKFCQTTGFKGDTDRKGVKGYQHTQKHTFYTMEGTFNLAEPTDTVSFRSNADFLLKNILAMYGGDKSGIKLNKQRIYFSPYLFFPPNHLSNNKEVPTYKTSYEQLLGRKYCSEIGFYTDYRLDISFIKVTKKYQIINSLFEMPELIPQDKIGREAALHLAEKTMLRHNKFPVSTLDKYKAKIWKEYIISYPETKSPYYFYVQSVWHINFPGALYENSTIRGIDINYDDEYTVDAYNKKINRLYEYPH